MGEASVGRPSEMEALLAAAEGEFGRLLPQPKSELGGIPDLDDIEKSVRAGSLGCGAKTCAALLETLEAELPTPSCPICGGCFPLDRALGLEGKNVTPGAESLYADAASSDGYGTASRKLGNLAGVTVPKSTLQRRSVRIGREVQAFEREDAEAAPLASASTAGGPQAASAGPRTSPPA